MKVIAQISLIVTAGFVCLSSADIYEEPLASEYWGGSPETIFDVDFDLEKIAGGQQIGSINAIGLWVSHSYTSDLYFVLTSPSGMEFLMLNSKVGADRDLGTGGAAEEDTMGYVWREFGDPIGGDFGDPPIPPGEYGALSWGTGPFSSGIWNIKLLDKVAQDKGAVGNGGFFIDYSTIPAPGALMLLGFGGIVAGRRRR